MRYLFGFLCVCALCVVPLIGCSDAEGAGGSGGSAGAGGSAGSGGIGGAGGMPECESAEDCDDSNECTANGCADGMCEFSSVQDGTTCGDGAGTCEAGSCAGTFACTEQGIRDAIAVGGGPHTFDCDGAQTVVTEAEIIIDNDVILDGEGNLTVDGDGNEAHRVFQVLEGVTAGLDGFTVTGGVVTTLAESGGGIWNSGMLTLTNSTVSENTSKRFGGGISNTGTLTTLTLTNSTVSGNTANSGGGLYNETGTLAVTNSTVSGNTQEGSCAVICGGGGIWNSGMLTLTNSTVSGNTRVGIFNFGIGSMATVVSSTVSGNTGDNIVNGAGAVLTFTNSMVAGECASFDSTAIAITAGYNIESPGDTCGFDQGTDLVNITEGQLDLEPLADNGGPTMTHALGPGSVAVDHIPAVDCEVTEDQRSQPRPETGGTMCDVGAVEVQPPPAEGCIQSGGTVSTALCCQSVESFPNTCLVGACGCAPDASHEVAVCICPTNTCFDGESCVAQ